MFKKIYYLILLLILAGAGWLIFYKTKNSTPIETNSLSQYVNSSITDIEIFEPKINAKITSPITISGRAKGYWFFEASFPIKITNDQQDHTLGQTIAQAQGDWMTENWVSFIAELKFNTEPTTSPNLWLIFDKDNPSGNPDLAASLHYPVLKQ